MSFAQGGELRAEIYIDLGDSTENETAFDAFETSKAQIESTFGETLRWERLDNRRACRIACYREGSIEDSADCQEEYRQWAIERLLCFRKVFGPRLSAVAKLAGQAP